MASSTRPRTRKPNTPSPPPTTSPPLSVTDGVWVFVALRTDSATYALHPLSIEKLKAAFPDCSIVSKVTISYETFPPPSEDKVPYWQQILILLCGVSLEKLRPLGTIRFFDTSTEEVIFSLPSVQT